MKIENNNQASGFTIIEFMVYVLIFSASMAIMGKLMVGLMQEQRIFMTERSLNQHGRFLLDRIGYTVRNAQVVEVNAPGRLKLTQDHYITGNKIYNNFTVISGQWHYAETSYPDPFPADWQQLSSPRVSVTDVTITPIKDSVIVGFTLNDNNDAVDFESVYVARQPDN